MKNVTENEKTEAPAIGTETGFGTAPDSAPETEAEKKAVECFKALEAAEQEFQPGFEFGLAMIALRMEIKASVNGRWMERLEELGITYEKARYWMAIAGGRSGRRGNGETGKKVKEKPPFDWDVALSILKPLVDDIEMLRRRMPIGASILEGELEKLAKILGRDMAAKERASA